MPLVPAVCTQCGAQIEVDDTHEAGVCKHCGTAFVTEKAICNYNNIYNITNNINAQNLFVHDSQPQYTKEYAIKRYRLTGDDSILKELYIDNHDDSELKYWYKGIFESDIPLYEIEHLDSMDKNELCVRFRVCIEKKDTKRCRFMLDKYPILSQKVRPQKFEKDSMQYVGFVLDMEEMVVSSIEDLFYIKDNSKSQRELCSVEWITFLFERGLTLDNGLYDYGDIGARILRMELLSPKNAELLALVTEAGYWQELPEKGCYIATCIYGSYDCPQVWTLRRFRDYTLDKVWYGRIFIRCYYAISPILVKLFGNQKWFRVFWKKQLDNMVSDLKQKGVEDTQYCD